jgi:hypothetical protein
MADFEVLGPYALALLMGMGSVCIFIWGVLAGAMGDSDQASLNFYNAEMANDRFSNHQDNFPD